MVGATHESLGPRPVWSAVRYAAGTSFMIDKGRASTHTEGVRGVRQIGSTIEQEGSYTMDQVSSYLQEILVPVDGSVAAEA